MSDRPSVVWFRCDLRLADNPALTAAVARGESVIPLFIWSPDEEGAWPPGAASRWWLHQSLVALERELREHESRLIIGRGAVAEALQHVVRSTKAAAVYWNRRYEPALVKRDRQVEEALSKAGTPVETFPGNLLFEPADVLTKERKPYRVFTPFWNACRALGEPSAPLAVPRRWLSPSRCRNRSASTRWNSNPRSTGPPAFATSGRPETRGATMPTNAVPRERARRIRPRPRSTGQRRHVAVIAPFALRGNHAAAGLARAQRRQSQEGPVFGRSASQVPG